MITHSLFISHFFGNYLPEADGLLLVFKKHRWLAIDLSTLLHTSASIFTVIAFPVSELQPLPFCFVSF